MNPKFPDFKKLTLDDRDQYLNLVSTYTPFSDISFTTLHIWWDLDEKLFFSVLNDNVILNYSQPFDPPGAGLCLIGTNKVDESIQELFGYLLANHRQPRLVHVPEFTIKNLRHPQEFKITEEADMHEYVMDTKAVASLQSPELGRIRRKVNRFLREVEDHQLELKSANLNSPEESEQILKSIKEWGRKYPKANDPGRTEMDALQTCLKHHRALEVQNLCVWVDGYLQGVALFHNSSDNQYLILNHLKVDYEIPFIFDYLTNQVAIKAEEAGAPYLNMEMDLGIEGLRQHKQGLRPIKFLKKYTVSPS